MTDNVYVENAESSLVFDRKPHYKSGQNLPGYFTFTTADYYKLNYPDGATFGPFDKLNLKGSLHFKCVVSALPEGEEE